MRWPFDPRKLALAEALFVLFMFGMAIGYVTVALSLAISLLFELFR